MCVCVCISEGLSSDRRSGSRPSSQLRQIPGQTQLQLWIYATGNNPESPDAVHPLHMTATNKYSVDIDALAFMYEPDPEWRVQEVRQQSSDKWEEEEEEDNNGAG